MTTTTLRDAAFYGRKSTDSSHVDEDAKSVPRQLANARAFARSIGCTIPDRFVFKDDNVSGAEALRRLPDKQRMLAAIRSGKFPPVLIVQKSDRLSRRDGAEALVELREIAKAGVEIWFYSKRDRFTYGDFKSNVSGYIEAEFNAEFRRVIAEKTTEAQLQRARLGHVIGSRGFGHRNIQVDKHGDAEVVEEERPVVIRIFELSAAGNGYSRIAKLLNAELVDPNGKMDAARCPKPRRSGAPVGWSPSSVRSVLHNELHRGVLVQFKTKKRNADGEVAATKRPPEEHVRVERKDLRIVSDDLWNAAHARLGRTRSTLTLADHRRREVKRRDYDSNYLLTGHVRCTVCGGSITVVSRQHGKRRAYFYGCLANWKKGAPVCANDLVLPIEKVNQAVLAAIAADTLRPAVVTAIIDRYLERLLPVNIANRVDALDHHVRAVDAKIANLSAAIEHGGNLPPLVAKLAERQKERESLVAEKASAQTLHQIAVDRPKIEAEVQQEIANWRGLLASEAVADGREFLRKVLAEPIRFTPDGKIYRFRGRTRMGELIAGAVLPTNVASPAGFEPAF
jgi:DNA invertase Pin-like site-specific DNA recombinase